MFSLLRLLVLAKALILSLLHESGMVSGWADVSASVQLVVCGQRSRKPRTGP